MKLNFKELNEKGVLPKSTGYLFTPLYVARDLYFYIVQIGHYYCTHSYAIQRDYFSPILILCIKAGCLHVHYRGNLCHLHPGDAMLVDCREPHYYYADMDGLEFYYLHFEGSNAHEICQHILDTRGAQVEKQNAAALALYIENTLAFFDRGRTESVFEGSHRVYDILRYLHGAEEELGDAPSYIDSINNYINDNIEQRITLQELSSHVSLSSFYFSRRFKKDTGYSPIEYVNRKKLDYAKTLLIRTDLPVSGIAEKAGFSFKGFIKLFAREEGCPPLAWRKKVQQHIHAGE